jgi:hypothetical protein
MLSFLRVLHLTLHVYTELILGHTVHRVLTCVPLSCNSPVCSELDLGCDVLSANSAVYTELGLGLVSKVL